MTTFTNTTDQAESIYVGYFGRAGDPSGTNYYVGQLNAGTITQSQMAASFAVSAEATTKYPYLANPNISNPTTFINQVYTNLFNRVADAAGLAYWTAQLTAAAGNPTAIGNFILNVISGATGTDSTIISNKVDVAKDFTTKATNANTAWTSATSTQSGAEIATVTDTAASVTAAKLATDTYIATAPGPALNLTVNTDTLGATGTNASFNGALFFNPGSGTFIQTLTNGDTLSSSGTGATLTASLNTAGAANVTTTGIGTMTLSNVQAGAAATAVTGSMTGVTTLTNTGSTSTGLTTVGSAGAGLKTALTTMNVTGTATTGGTTAIIAAAALAGTADALTVNVTGALGAAGTIQQIAAGTDGAIGTTATPQNAYETITVNASGATFINLSGAGTGGVLSTTTLNLAGAGATTVSAAAAGDFSKLTTINATTNTGGVTITGANTGTGLLNGNTALTSFKGGTGADSLDLSSFTTAAAVAAITAGNLDGGTGTARDTLILSAAAANTTVALNNSNFEIIGVIGATGTIDTSKFGTGVDTLALTTAAAGALTLTNVATGYTLATGANIATFGITATGPSGLADVFNVTGTNSAALTYGAQVFNAFETINETFTGTAAASAITIASIATTPTAGGVVVFNLIDNAGANNVSVGGTTGIGTGTLNVSGTGTAGVTFTGVVTASVVNASGLNTAAAAGTAGLVLTAGTAAASTITGSNGADTLVGSAAVDTILGGTGNDTINAAAGADTITTGTGADILGQADNFAAAGQSIVASTNTLTAGGIVAGNTLTFATGSAGSVDRVTDFTSGTDTMNVVTAATAPTTLIGVTSTLDLATGTTYVAYGSYAATTGVFTIATSFVAGVSADALVVVGDAGALTPVSTTGYQVLVGLNQALVAADFV